MLLLRHALSTALVSCALLSCSQDGAAVPNSLPGEAASRVAAASAPVTLAPLAIPADAPLIAFLGDSITAGLHLSVEQAFPALLQRKLAAMGLPFRLVNAGVSGDTSSGGLRRLAWVLQSRPELLVIELGGNDGLRGQPLNEVEANLRRLIEQTHSAGCAVLLLGVQLPPSLGADYAAAFAAIYPRVAEQTGVRCVPDFFAGVGGLPQMNLEDGLHPTPQGHQRLADNALPAVREWLEARARAGLGPRGE